MAGFGLQMFGVAEMLLFFKEMQKLTDFGEAWVGSAVVYGPMQEFGTEQIAERPHWRVVIPEIVAEISGDLKVQGGILDAFVSSSNVSTKGIQGAGAIESGGTAPMQVALMVERRVKQVITAKGIIDTNNYRGSVATGRTHDLAFAKSASRTKDKDSIAK